ncbi:exopolysaccharide biosynthesis protein [Algoriphagus marincola]|uniref:Exopolysaccharide biosynthesis protein n=1 Tax=Algoriphagus marincola TaxID=264027 RepID=A0ABS7N0Q3_9BACT|nr:Wzz/FepE/Etk N-terminal domain-containing protein [Algoriphagus marincola]MBY5949908.1 exopolysaccharide biosynthesis protein [Algoriphagus marincola]
MQSQQPPSSYPNPYFPPQPNPEDEIDLLELVKKLWDRRSFIIKILTGFIVLGLLVAFLSPVEYTASSTFIPQVASGQKPGGLSGLASLAGINLGEMGDGQEIPPTLYPKLAGSVKFQKALIQTPITNPETGQPITYSQYFEEVYQPGLISSVKKYTLGLPGLLLKAIRGESESVASSDTSLVFVSEEEKKHFERLASQLSVTTNEKEGFVQLSFIMPNAVMSAQMALAAQKLLQEEVIAFRIRNAKEQLLFTEERYREKKAEFESMQRRLAAYRDRNKNIITASAQSEVQRLEAEFNLAFSVYNELAKQLEQARLQVSKDTPVFSDIQSVSVPTEKSAPKRPLTLVIFTMLGLIVGIGWVFGSDFYANMKEEWDKKGEEKG